MVKRGVLAWLMLVVVCLAVRGQARPVLSRPQQAVLLEQAGSYFYVVKYASIDLDSSIIVAARSLGISLLPLMTGAIPGDVPAALSNWVANEDPAAGKNQLPELKGMAYVQQLYLLGSWYAFQSTVHPDRMDSAIGYLFKARAETKELKSDIYTRRCACLLGKAFLGKNDTISGNAWFREAIDECHRANDTAGEAMAWRYWGVYLPLLPALAPERIAYLKKAGALYPARKEDPSQINVLMHIGYQSFSIARVADAQTNFEDAIRIEDSLHWPYTHYTTDVLALCALTRGSFDEDLRYALRSVKTAEQTRDSLCWSTFYLRLASVYTELPMFTNEYIYWSKKAIDRLLVSDGELFAYQYANSLCSVLKRAHRVNEILPLINRVNHRYPPGNVVDSLYDHLLLRNYAECIHDTAAEMKYALLAYAEGARVEAVRPFMRGQRDFFLAFAWFHRGDYKRAEPLFRTFLASPLAQTQQPYMEDAYRYLLQIDTATGHIAAAASDYHKFYTLDSTGFSTTQAKQVELLRVQYEVAEREKDILLLQTETRLQEHQLRQATFVRGFSIGGIILLLVISGLLYNRYRLKQRSNRLLQLQKTAIDTQNAQLQTLVNEKEELLIIKDWLMKELNHRVGNNLHFMMSVQNMQAHSLTSKEALSAITQSNNRLYAMSLIHKKLYQPDREGSIDMVQYIGDLALHLSEALSPDNHILLETRVAPIELDVSQAIPVGLILNEAITNAYKYAFKDMSTGLDASGPDASRPLIGISLQPLGETDLEVVIRDNGKGYTPAAEKSKRSSLGLVLMEMLTTQLHGTLTILNEEGLTIHLQFPAEFHPAAKKADYIENSGYDKKVTVN